MTSLPTIGPEQQRLEGRTVRDIVEYDPAQVNEVWCRKIFRQLLQSLELQYGMQMPHRAITPDTVVFHDNGEPLLQASDIAVPESEQNEAADLTALARVVHFAITRELAPAGPLHGRVPEGYSESLLGAVDRCMSGDPAERPRTIDELRQLLGIVSLGAVVPASIAVDSMMVPDAPHPAAEPASAPKMASAATAAGAVPSFLRETPATKTRVGLSRWQRRALAAGAAAALLAVGLALFAELRDSGSYDHIVLTLPQSGEPARGNTPPPRPAMPATSATAPQAAQNEPQAGTAGPAIQPAAGETAAPAVPPAPARPAQTAPAPTLPEAAVAGSATYRLQIRPWGVVYVDGIDRGVSPPIKRLVLAPGRHTIRIANPNFQDRVLEVDTEGGNAQISADFNDEPRQVRTHP